ncbi:MAG: hypothetical protein GHCLOJNM_01564 [bacterium]|nr:hypothetical protein [bacterium]
MLVAPDDPLSESVEFGDGWTSVGRLVELDHVVEGDRVYCVWDYELLPGFEDSDAALHVWEDGVYWSRFPAALKSFEYVMRRGAERVSLEVALAPAWEGYEGWHHVPLWVPRQRAHVTWEQVGRASRVEVFRSLGADPDTAEDEPVADMRDSVVSVEDPAGSVSGNEFRADGKWRGAEAYAEVTVEVTSGGVAGVAEFTATYGEETMSGTTWSVRRELFNGIRCSWGSGTFEAGDSWTVRVAMPEEWTSGPLADGEHRVTVSTVNALGLRTDEGPVSATVDAYPSPPTLVSVVRDPSSGATTFTWRSPDEADVVRYRVFRNRVGDDGGLLPALHWFPVADGAVGPDEEFSVVLTDLVPGENRLVARMTDAAGNEERNLDYAVALLTEDYEMVDEVPSAPESLTARVLEDGTVRATVVVDSTSTVVRVYVGDSLGGPVDYESVVAQVVNPQAGDLQVLTVDFELDDGTYLIGARASNDGWEEQNEETFRLVVDTAAAAAVVSLAAEVV